MTQFNSKFETLSSGVSKSPTKSKYSKESYITARSQPVRWREHANVKTMEEYSEYIHGSVLDVGCNHGGATYFLRLFDAVTEVHGADINRDSLLVARKNFRPFDIPYYFHCFNVVEQKLPRQFDTIVSFHVLEHIYEEDVNSFLFNIYQMLRAGGHFIISIPYETAYPDKCHVTFWNEDSLAEAMEKAGFETIECFKDDRWPQKNHLTGLFRRSI